MHELSDTYIICQNDNSSIAQEKQKIINGSKAIFFFRDLIQI